MQALGNFIPGSCRHRCAIENLKGFKLFGERAIAVMIKEFSQLDNGVTPGKPVVEPVDPKTLTKLDIEKALEAVNLIKNMSNQLGYLELELLVY